MSLRAGGPAYRVLCDRGFPFAAAATPAFSLCSPLTYRNKIPSPSSKTLAMLRWPGIANPEAALRTHLPM